MQDLANFQSGVLAIVHRRPLVFPIDNRAIPLAVVCDLNRYAKFLQFGRGQLVAEGIQASAPEKLAIAIQARHHDHHNKCLPIPKKPLDDELDRG